MVQFQSLSLKFLYHLTGFPLLLMIILTADKFEENPQQAIWWSAMGCIVVVRLLLEKEKYQTGGIAASWKTMLLALLAAIVTGMFVYQLIL